MKKALVLLSLLLSSFWAEANPLFANVVKIVVRGNLEYSYDSYGNIVVREDVGSAGYLYDNNGNAFACFSTDDNPNSRVGAYYYDLDGNYLGKVVLSAGPSDLFGTTLIIRTYLDHKNRPVAKFVQKSDFSELSDAVEQQDKNSAAESYLNFLFGEAYGIRVSKVFELSGRIQRYRN